MKTTHKLLAGAATAAWLMATPALAADLIYASFYPPQHLIHEHGISPMIKELQGDIKIDFAPGGQLFNAMAALEGVGNKMADVGLGVTTYWPSDLKHVNVLAGLMLLGGHPMIMNAAYLDTMFFDCEECKSDYSKANTLHLASVGAGNNSLICNFAVTQLSDLKGKRVRVTGGPNSRLVQSIGAQTVNLTVSDMVEGFHRRIIDCILGPLAWIKSYPMIESVKSIYDHNKGVFVGIGLFVVNRDSWRGLKPKQREKIIQALPRAIAGATIRGYLTEDQLARKSAVDAGVKIVKAGPDFEKAYSEFAKGEIPATLAAANKVGVKNGERIAKAFTSNIEKWTDIVAKANVDLNDVEASTTKYEKLLWEHIYSKLDPERLLN